MEPAAILFLIFLIMVSRSPGMPLLGERPGRGREIVLVLPRDLARRPESITRRQSEQVPRHLNDVVEAEPSCAELRAMWRHMSRMARHSEITNEIPQMPIPFPTSTYGHQSRYTRPSVQHDPRQRFATTGDASFFKPYRGAVFGKIIRNPEEKYHHTFMKPGPVYGHPRGGFDAFPEDNYYRGKGKSGRIPGHFSSSPFPEETLGLYGTILYTPEEKAMYDKQRHLAEMEKARQGWDYRGRQYGDMRPVRPWQTKPKYMFGRVVKTTPSSVHYQRPQPTIPANSPSSGLVPYPHMEDNAIRSTQYGAMQLRDVPRKYKGVCQRLENRICKSDLDCSCKGLPGDMYCVAGKCRSNFKSKQAAKNKWEAWSERTKGLSYSRRKRQTFSDYSI